MTLDPRLAEGIENDKVLKQFPPYGSIDGCSASDTCPTCRGTGRIPRGHENQLVAVIPCNDVRLKPRRTKLYVFISMVICLLICCLILFFLFPRSVSITPVSVLSVTVYFTPDSVDMEVKNLLNITNDNFVPVQIRDFNMQGLVEKTVMGKTKMTNLTAIKSRSKQSDPKWHYSSDGCEKPDLSAIWKVPEKEILKLSITEWGLKLNLCGASVTARSRISFRKQNSALTEDSFPPECTLCQIIQ